MAFGTIVVHLANDSRHRDRLDFAIGLARAHGAHLVVLYVTAPVHMPAGATGRAASYALLAEASAISAERARDLEREAMASCAQAGLSWEWRIEEDAEHDAAIAHYALLADQLIVGQAESRHDDGLVTLVEPEHAALKSGCPVLILPAKGGYGAIGHRVMVAWKGGREANRALRDALPLLARAEGVVVLGVDPPDTAVAPGRSVLAYLKRHGIAAEAVSDFGSDRDAGPTILAQARALNCDTIVMGARVQSRLSDLLFGGATRHVIDHSDRALLLAD